METVLHKPNPPPFWDITLTLREDGDPQYLRKAHLIITSYLEPAQVLYTRIKKGTHRFQLHSVGEPVDRSILQTVKNETWPHIQVVGGNYYVKT